MCGSCTWQMTMYPSPWQSRRHHHHHRHRHHRHHSQLPSGPLVHHLHLTCRNPWLSCDNGCNSWSGGVTQSPDLWRSQLSLHVRSTYRCVDVTPSHDKIMVPWEGSLWRVKRRCDVVTTHFTWLSPVRCQVYSITRMHLKNYVYHSYVVIVYYYHVHVIIMC